MSKSYNITEKLHEGSETIVYRGVRNIDNLPVVVKAPKNNVPHPREIAKLTHQFEIIKDIKIPGIITAYEMERNQDSARLIMEDFNGRSLQQILSERTFTVEEVLQIGIRLAETLSILHKQNIIHKDIKPHNIIVNLSTGEVKITDFGIATRINHELKTNAPPSMLEGTLAYISPEQTGRMNRSIDHRSDLYSLGVTLYEMITGVLPFQSNDPLELVHSHIARRPVPPSDVYPSIPTVVSDIIMKLLAKNAEDRYQQADGLKADLQLCLDRLRTHGEISPFPLGKHDLSDGFHIPQKLYGREQELEILMNAFEQVSEGQCKFVLVSGYSGVGKSALVNEIHKPVVRERGYFISGKFDQYRRNMPYASLLQAFRDLLQQILSEPETRLEYWKNAITTTLGNKASVIIELLPELEQLIGPQPPATPLGPTETQNRFQLALFSFLEVFTQQEHPLVLFLDDLQWSDAASLKFIQQLVTNINTHYLLLIGAYRDNEVNASHPLMITIDEIQQLNVPIHQIVLQPLGIEHVNQLLSDTFNLSLEETKELTQVIYSKTLGNPFFLNQFLKMLNEERLIVYDRTKSWTWDIEQIRQSIATDNVVDFLTAKLHRLSPTTQNLLMLAACIGNQFDIATLAYIYQKPLGQTIRDLGEAIQEGLLIPATADFQLLQSYVQDENTNEISDEFDTNCRFLHDRVQQTAYQLLDDEKRQMTHLKIGRLLLANTPPEERDEHIFDIVNQLNIGINLIDDPEERLNLAQFNLIAGSRARVSNAYEAAVSYLETGIQLLPPQRWKSHYKLTKELYHEQAIDEALLGHFEEAEKLFDELLQHLHTIQEKAKVYVSRLDVYHNLGKYAEGVALGCSILKEFGVEFPTDEAERGAAIGASLQAIAELLKDRRIEDLEFAPPMNNIDKQLAMQLLMSLMQHAFVVSQSLFALAMLEMVTISLKHGNTELSAHAYVSYALMLTMSGNYTDAQRFGKLAIRINELYPDANLRASTQQVMGAFIDPWNNHLRSSLAYLNQAYLDSLEVGNLRYAVYSSWCYTLNRFSVGDELHRILADVNKYLDFTQSQKDTAFVISFILLRQLIFNLQGKTSDVLLLDTDQFSEQEFLSQTHIPNNICMYHIHKLIVYYYNEEYQLALEEAQKAAEMVALLATVYFSSELTFYHALTVAALYPTAEPEQQAQLLEMFQSLHERMKVWAQHAPTNFQAKEHLLAAEYARMTNQMADAVEFYDLAIDSARENEFLHIEALSLELASKYYLGKGRTKIAKLYMSDAYTAYMHWGAGAKLQQLSDNYSTILPNISEIITTTGSRSRISTDQPSTDHGRGEMLDMATVIKAAQAISSEMVLDNLLKKLNHIVIESAGAQKGVLLLEQDEELLIESKITVDPDIVELHLGPMTEKTSELPTSLIRYVRRSGEPLVLHNAAINGRFATDAYIAANQCKSILCLPLVNQGRITGLLYLENNLSTHVFTPARIELLRLLSSQAAIAIENAQLYTNSQIMAQNLSEAYKQLQHELKERQQAEEQRAALQEEIIHAQKSILAELSTPLIPITDDIVIMPLIGSLDTQRAEQVLTALLDGTQRHHPRVVIIDITGVPVVDTGVASTLIHAAQAVRLLGAQTFISGIRPEVAQTLVGLGVELNGIITQGTLQSSIAYALQSANALGRGRANGHINGNGKGQSFYQFSHIGNKPK